MSRNIVLVSIDSLRADHCGFLSDEHDLTPAMDRIASEGVAYENAIAPGPRTPSSMPTVFTGRFGPVDPVESWEFSHRQERISRHLARYETFAERLRERGYTTVGVTTNPWTSDFHFTTSFAKGFDRWTDLISANDSIDLHTSGDDWISRIDPLLDGRDVGRYLHWSEIKDWFLQWPQYYEFLLDQISDVAEPYFLWVFALDPHKPYVAPAEYRRENSRLGMYYSLFWEYIADPAETDYPAHVERRLKQSYRDTVRSVDGFVDSLTRDLADDDPALVVHSDHGEAFGEHGTFGHLQELYQENLHVPLVVSNVDRTARVEGPTPLAAVHEIVTALADDDREFEPEAYTAPMAPSTTEDGEKAALTGRRWKFITDGDTAEVYDLAADPDEQTDLVDTRPEVRDRLAAVLSRERATHAERLAISQGIEGILTEV